MIASTAATAAFAGYVLGSLPFGYFVARAKGVNIFEVGSGNPGATNVRRVLGAGPGNLVFALDLLKGVAAAGWPQLAGHAGGTNWDRTLVSIVGLAAALVGHSFSCFTGFRGGKGVATATGGLLVLMPEVTLIGGLVWVVTFYATGYVSLASILGAAILPAAALLLGAQMPLVGVAGLVGLFVVVRHRANIGRLLNGTENKFSRKPAREKGNDGKADEGKKEGEKKP